MTIRNGKDMDAKTIARMMRIWYLSKMKIGDRKSRFYCGITNDPQTRMSTHEREDHEGREIEKVVVYECDSVNIAIEVETKMSQQGFDIGDPCHDGNGAVEDSKYVYLYRKP